MDASRFDLLSRMLANSPTRRAALAGFAALLGRTVVDPDQTVAQSRICRPLGGRCFPDRGLDCCRGECRSGRCRCPKGQHRCGNRCLRQGRRCQSRRPRRGCRPNQQRCRGRCIAKQACCGGCPTGQTCRHGGCCNVTTTAELQAALSDGGPDTIRLCPKTTYQGTFTIARTVTVIGAGATSSVLDGAGSGPVVTITEAVTDAVELRGLGVVNGVTPDPGGGIRANGPLTLTRCRVANNEASVSGGGIRTGAAVTLVDTVVTGNRCIGSGGGIAVEGEATTTLLGSSRVEKNEVLDEVSAGGGIYVSAHAGVILRDRSQVRQNRAPIGGGLYVSSDATARLRDDSRVEANTAAVSGGGVLLRPSSQLELRDRSVITRNESLGGADTGGGIRAVSPVTVDLPDAAMVSGNTPDQCQPSFPTADGGTCE